MHLLSHTNIVLCIKYQQHLQQDTVLSSGKNTIYLLVNTVCDLFTSAKDPSLSTQQLETATSARRFVTIHKPNDYYRNSHYICHEHW